MQLTKDLELIKGLPVLYIKSINAIVVSDLHLGYEAEMAKNGLFIPQANLKSIIKTLATALEGRKVDKIIVVGDIKNEFSKIDVAELNELNDLLSFIRTRKLELILIKGNHDNFIESYSKHMGIRVYHAEARIGGYMFVHGDKELLVKANAEKPKLLIIGHVHPAIGIPTALGRIERLRCFLYGEHKMKPRSIKILVLPAIGYFETGTNLNLQREERGRSALLKRKELEEMEAIAFGYGSTISFGKIRQLRKLNRP